MKKIVFLISLLALAGRGFSQVYLLQEYFNNSSTIPAGWKTIDQDGDGHTWHVFTFDSIGYAVSDSWIAGVTGSTTPNNYLISPNIDLQGLSGTVKLRYTLQVPDPQYYAEHYKVAISTTGNTVADFNNVVMEETCTAADYYEVFPYWHERIVDLSSFIGQKIYIAWVHYKCTNQYQLLLDSIEVSYFTNVNATPLKQAAVNVYPNPAAETISVEGLFENAEIQLLTMDGRQVYRKGAQSKQARIDVSHFANGIYILRIQSQQGLSTQKIKILHH